MPLPCSMYVSADLDVCLNHAQTIFWFVLHIYFDHARTIICLGSTEAEGV